MWCPRCDQGFVVKVEVLKTGVVLFVCMECDATWFNKGDVGILAFFDFGTYMMEQGSPPLWSEVRVLDDRP